MSVCSFCGVQTPVGLMYFEYKINLSRRSQLFLNSELCLSIIKERFCWNKKISLSKMNPVNDLKPAAPPI